jgi:hypothetical protein
MGKTKLAELERRIAALERRLLDEDARVGERVARMGRPSGRWAKGYLLIGAATAAYVVWMMFSVGASPLPQGSTSTDENVVGPALVRVVWHQVGGSTVEGYIVSVARDRPNA